MTDNYTEKRNKEEEEKKAIARQLVGDIEEELRKVLDEEENVLKRALGVLPPDSVSLDNPSGKQDQDRES